MEFNIDTVVSKRIFIRSYLDIPKGVSQPPLIVYLHGAGERDVDFSKLIKYSIRNEHNKDFAILMPHCPPNEMWNDDVVAELVKSCLAFGATDTKRVYLTGLSMGARGVWSIGTAYPELFSALVAISGFSCYLKAANLRKTPCLIFHGIDDKIVPYEESFKMHHSIKEHGGYSEMYALKCRHDNIKGVYNDRFIYKWMLQYKLGA